MTRINKVRKAIKYITGKEVTGDFNTIGQLLDGFNKDCEENGLQIGGGDNTFIVNGTARNYSSANGYSDFEFDKTHSEIWNAVQEKKQVIVYFSANGNNFILHGITPENTIFMGLYNKWNDMGGSLYNDVKIGRLALFSESNIYFDEFTIATKPSS